MTSERRWPSVCRDLPFDGLDAADLDALAGEGAIQSSIGETQMDVLMRIMMGGWIHSGSRTQWTAFLVALVAMIQAVMAWGAGDMAFMDFLKEVQAQWLVFANAYAIYFVGEKIDNKTLVKK
jgi:hypothetical protein